MQTPLYNLAPVLQVMGLGLLLAGVPLTLFWHRQRHAAPSQRLKALTLLILTLTFELVLVGAFTRLTDSGLGCPDWPGCYGQASPLGAHASIAAAQQAMPTGPVTHSKAWIEMVHRYLATSVGVLIMVLTFWTWRVWRREPRLAVHPMWPALTLVWVSLQGAFGALTVTMKLFPAIVTTHLLLAVGLLVLLMVQAVRYSGWQEVAVSPGLRRGLLAVATLLLVQIALGGWVSTNYAVLACEDFPLCQGSVWPAMDWSGFALWRELGHNAAGELLAFSALVSIHVVHRSLAWLVLVALTLLGWRLTRVAALQRAARVLLALTLLQLLTGMSNVVLDWPLPAALLHTGGASALMLTLVWLWARSRSSAVSSFSAKSVA